MRSARTVSQMLSAAPPKATTRVRVRRVANQRLDQPRALRAVVGAGTQEIAPILGIAGAEARLIGRTDHRERATSHDARIAGVLGPP